MNSIAAGMIGSFIANPVDLSLIRLQGDNVAPIEQRKGYKNVVDTLIKVAQSEGVGGLWKGSVPTMFRAGMMNLGQLSTNEQVREVLANNGFKSWTFINLTSATIAGFVAATLCMPFDNAKTRLQNMRPDKDGK